VFTNASDVCVKGTYASNVRVTQTKKTSKAAKLGQASLFDLGIVELAMTNLPDINFTFKFPYELQTSTIVDLYRQ
jgi:hypothetical protein